MDAELNNKIKEIGSLFGINELPDNIGDIIGSFIGNSNNESQLDKTICEQNMNYTENDDSIKNYNKTNNLLAAFSGQNNKNNCNTSDNNESDFPDIDISKIISLITKYQKSREAAKNDNKIKLLYALKPFLNDKRKNKISNCVTLLTIAKMVDL